MKGQTLTNPLSQINESQRKTAGENINDLKSLAYILMANL
jgi:hypothetical protein